jgi:hypothetical protein
MPTTSQLTQTRPKVAGNNGRNALSLDQTIVAVTISVHGPDGTSGALEKRQAVMPCLLCRLQLLDLIFEKGLSRCVRLEVFVEIGGHKGLTIGIR